MRSWVPISPYPKSGMGRLIGLIEYVMVRTQNYVTIHPNEAIIHSGDQKGIENIF